MTETPLQSIGRILGGRDHTTIIHGSEKIACGYEIRTKILKKYH